MFIDLNKEELSSKENLSTRAFNVLGANGISNLSELISYYKKYGDFERLNNCGKKTSEELVDVCQKYAKLKGGNDYLTSISAFNHHQGKVFDDILENSFKNLPKAAKRLFNDKLGEEFSSKQLISFLLNQLNIEKLKTLDGFGNKKISDIREFKLFVLDVIEKISKKENSNDLIIDLLQEHGLERESLKNIFKEFDDQFNGFPIFRFCQKAINSGTIFNKKEDFIFRNYFNYYKINDKNKTLEEIGNHLELSRERVRQIRNKILSDFNLYFSFLKPLSLKVDIEEKYGINLQSDFIYISEGLARKINDEEDTRFTRLFLSKIFLQFCSSTHSLLGHELNYHNAYKAKKYLDLDNPYIFSNEILGKFEAKNFIEDIERRLNSDIKESYSLNLKSYLSRYCESINLDLLDILEEPIKKILRLEYNLLLKPNGNIIFHRNKGKFIYEMIEEVLEKLGFNEEGYHITEINRRLNEIYPEVDYSDNFEGLRGIINRYNNKFIHIGRSSTYGLKKWEKEFDTFKGGTIRDIVEECMFIKDRPLHISELVDYVNKYRDTNEQNIYGNLKLDQSKTFKFFGNGFIGLKSKKYKKGKTNFNDLNGFVFTEKNLKKYLPAFYDELITIISKDCNVLEVQVKAVIDKKIQREELQINNQNMVIFTDGEN